MTRGKEGQAKVVFKLDDGNFLLKFKDDVTGEDGKFDPGANTVGLSIEGMGKAGLRMTDLFYKKIEAAGIPTHFIEANFDDATLKVRPATVFGEGLEVICRLKAAGSFIRRYGQYAKEGQDLQFFVEVTLKDDARGDPPISRDGAAILGITTPEEYDDLVDFTKRIAVIVRDELAKKGLELYDIKFEFGRGADGKVMLIDEISAGNMRAFKNGKWIEEPLELARILLG
jgi:phosphoribosylaminoimidazole-succinocarboxamide synthase